MVTKTFPNFQYAYRCISHIMWGNYMFHIPRNINIYLFCMGILFFPPVWRSRIQFYILCMLICYSILKKLTERIWGSQTTDAQTTCNFRCHPHRSVKNVIMSIFIFTSLQTYKRFCKRIILYDRLFYSSHCIKDYPKSFLTKFNRNKTQNVQRYLII